MENNNEINELDATSSPLDTHDHLPQLATVNLENIFGFFPAAGIPRISHHFDRFATLFAEEGKLDLKLLHKLLSHAAIGELVDAESIWRAHPYLLTYHGTVYHPNRIYTEGKAPVHIPFHHNPGSYKYINKTAYQILKMNGEDKEAKAMETLMSPEEIKRQLHEIFPDGENNKPDWDLQIAITLLQDVFDKIAEDETINEKNLDKLKPETRVALYALHDYAKPTSEHEIGLVFDAKLYHAALELYNNKAKKSFKQNFGRHRLWCIRVEEWLAGCLGTGYLRPHAQGIRNKVLSVEEWLAGRSGTGYLTHEQGIGNNAVHRRGCVLTDNSSYFAFRRSADSIPVINYANRKILIRKLAVTFANVLFLLLVRKSQNSSRMPRTKVST